MFDPLRFIVIPFLVLSFLSTAQEVTVRGQFQQDSIKIGIVFPYTLSAQYPKSETVVFPDSTYSFAPFEFDHKTYFGTISSDQTSYDSVVYYLTSFEIDSIQSLSLPVFVVHDKDCTSVYANHDSVILQHMVAAVPDSVSIEQLPLKTNTAYLAVKWLLNYPLVLISGAVVLVVLVVIWITFGKRIKKYMRLRKLNKYHKRFLTEFNQAVDQLQNNYSAARAEATLRLWKQYMEGLLASPITKYTSKEIFNLVRDESLAQALGQIDRSIYSDRRSLEKETLTELQKFTEQKFNEKVQVIRNG